MNSWWSTICAHTIWGLCCHNWYMSNCAWVNVVIWLVLHVMSSINIVTSKLAWHIILSPVCCRFWHRIQDRERIHSWSVDPPWRKYWFVYRLPSSWLCLQVDALHDVLCLITGLGLGVLKCTLKHLSLWNLIRLGEQQCSRPVDLSRTVGGEVTMMVMMMTEGKKKTTCTPGGSDKPQSGLRNEQRRKLVKTSGRNHHPRRTANCLALWVTKNRQPKNYLSPGS